MTNLIYLGLEDLAYFGAVGGWVAVVLVIAGFASGAIQ